MKVSISWLKELVELNCSIGELANLLLLRSISTKEVTDEYIELDMKGYNRADLLSMHGVALEIAAITGSKLTFEEPKEANFAWNTEKLPYARVTVENDKLCPFYSLVKIEGLRVEPSNPDWVKKLNDSGIRSINNVADVTNLIMLEYGQPLHSFDADKVEDGEIIVREAKKDEEITTLDGKKRKLSTTDLLITDPKKPIGIAGVMGGKNTEVTESTTTILLEAAIFDPIQIRKTATRLGLQSEAAKRFQHGLTKKRLLQALNAAIKMYEDLGGKVTAVTLVGNLEDPVKKITLTKDKLELLVGIKFDEKQVEEYLQRLGANVIHLRGGWEVTVPYWRLDIEIEEDVIEEVARMYGYEKIPSKAVSKSKPLQTEDPIFKTISDLRQKLVDLGLTEVQTYSFYSTSVLEALVSDKEKLVKVANPISAETEYLKEFLWPNLVEAVGRNLRKGFKDIAVFEIGKAFNVAPDGKIVEGYRLAIALMNGSDNPLAELQQISQNSRLHPNVGLSPNKGVNLTKDLFHPARQIDGLAEVHLRVLNKLGITKRVAILEIELN